MAAASPGSSCTLEAFSAGVARPGASGSTACPAMVRVVPCSDSATASRRVAVISSARVGGGLASHEAATGDRSLIRRTRSEEHTSELQSQSNLVCRLLLEKKKKNKQTNTHINNTTEKNKA